jgi:DNA primase
VIDKPDIVEIIESQGVPLRKRGKYFWGLCPLPGHIEKTPSFKVDPEKKSFYCFGCHEGGDVIAFIQKYKYLSFKEALSYLGINDKLYKPDSKEFRKRELLQQFKQWCNEYYNDLCFLYRTLQRAKTKVKSEEDLEILSSFYHKESIWISQIEILQGNNDTEKINLFEKRYLNEHLI